MILNYKNSKIHYTTEGEGEAVVLLHGFLESLEMWNDFIPELSRTHQVICIDLLGHGKTDCLGYVHTMEQMADAVYAVVQSLNIESAHFIGHSMGGYVSLALAEAHPELFIGLCLMNSSFDADNNERKLIRTRACKMAQMNYKVLINMSFANLFTEESKIKHETEYHSALQLALKTPLQGYIAAQEGMKLRPYRFESYKNLKAHKLIIIGRKDGLINSEQLINQIKQTDINYIEFSEGHMSSIENKSDLSYNILRFIEK
ncbi:alpha/beta hydrolase [uncultured Winogradskyella sp.]|uniref:alpha/beta fold hydrolase n=1 Tax=uncultured Winogradskyella sp. TaxID=395353 RepID=UPI00262A2C0E|nr:alpha/beta hydrolase [uncultured Winogradskyella sp.]|tara:strand:- start:194 stop:970 length:777 start_codon:yes stop_codon:yes gene_type:complete